MKTSFTLIGLVYIWSTWSMFIHRDDANSAKINLNDAEYRTINTFKTVEGAIKYKKQQQYKGVDIFGATLVIEEVDENTLSPVSGKYYDTSIIKEDFNDDVTPTISSDDALKTAISHYIPNGDVTDLFGYEYGESQRTTSVVLNLYKNENDGINAFTLSYIVEFTYQQTETEEVHRTFSVINAKTGDMLYTFGAMIGQDHAWGTGGNAKVGDERHGPMEINASPNLRSDRVEAYRYPLQGSNNPTIGTCNFDTPSICEIQDDTVNTAKCALADAYMWAGTVFNLYDDWGPRNQITGQPIPPLAPQNLPLRFYVHYGTNFENAFYSGGAMYFGDGNTRFYPLVSLDVSAHEVAHGFTDQGSGLRYQDQSGGINEAYSDLAGEAAEGYYRGKETIKWICGYDIDKQGNCGQPQCGLRYLYNPPLDGNSIDHVDNYFNGMNVHYSSGVYNKGWYNLATMDGWYDWDVQSVFLLASQANYYHWSRDTNYNQGLCGLQAAVEDIFPSNEWIGRKQDIALAWQNQGVYCQTNNDQVVKSNNPLNNNDDSNNNKLYYIYGGIGAILFVIIAIIMILYFYKRKIKILKNQLNIDNEDHFYGTIVTQDQQ